MSAAAGGLRLPRGLRAPLVAAAARGELTPALPGALYQELLARRDRRAAGVYYTPPHLVDLVIGRALAPAGDGARVLDPACGAGAFLVAALEHLVARAVAAGARPGVALRARLCRQLIGIDRDPVAVELCRLALAIAIAGDDALARPAALARAAGSVVLADALATPPPAVDVVIGNPPWGQKGFALPADERARLRATFATCARGVIDPYAPFVELAHRALAPGGRWGLVLPDVVLLKNQPVVRELMLAGSALELIAHAGRAFPAVNLDAVVIVGRRVATPPHRHVVEAWDEAPATGARPRAARRRRIPQRVFVGLPGQVLNLGLDAAARARLAALAALPRLGDAFEIHEGVHSGNARAKLFVDARPRRGERLIVGGTELARHRLAWAGRWLDRSPGALDRAAGDYANLGRPEWFARDKIVVRRTGDRVVAAFDDQGFAVSNNLFVVLPRTPRSRDELLAITALLNARFMTAHFRTVVPRVGRLFAELKIHHLAGFPLPAPAALAKAAPALARLAERRSAEAADADALDEAIDRRVEALY